MWLRTVFTSSVTILIFLYQLINQHFNIDVINLFIAIAYRVLANLAVFLVNNYIYVTGSAKTLYVHVLCTFTKTAVKS